jgi:hypothetical protein
MINTEYVIGGVDTHKDIHVAAVVNESNQVLASESFPMTRHGYKKMLTWSRHLAKFLEWALNAQAHMALAYCVTCKLVE